MNLSGFFQNAYVTRDLDKAIETFKAVHGVPEFITLELDNIPVKTVYGEGPVKLRVALGWIDNLQIELIEPVSGLCRHYTDYLPDDADSSRFHHVCMRVSDMERTRAEVAAQGGVIVYEGEVPGCAYIYVDARATIGHYVEYLWMSEEMWAGTGGKDIPYR